MKTLLVFIALFFTTVALAFPPVVPIANAPGSGGGGSSDAQTIDGLNGSDLITTSLTTNTTPITMNVASGNDITCASGTDCAIGSSGASPLIFGSGVNRWDWKDSTGTVRGSFFQGNSYQFMYSPADGTASWQVNADGFHGGFRLAVTNTQKIFSAAKAISSDFSNTGVFMVHGNGKLSTLPETVTCPAENAGAAATETFDPGSSNVFIVNNDTNGCELTLLETSGVVNSKIEFKVITNAGGVVKLMDSPNVVVATTACDTTGIGVGGRAFCDYVDDTNDYNSCTCVP